MSVTAERALLRADVKERRALLPKLKTALRTAKQRRRGRLGQCRRIAKSRRRRLRAAIATAQRKLKARIRSAKERATRAAKVCRTRGSSPAEIDRALAALEGHRKTIAELQAKVSRKSSRGRAGGLRAAELRAESDDEVRRDIADDPLLVAAWEKVKSKVHGSSALSRTEAFLQHIHNHPEVLDEVRSAQEHKWAREAEEAFRDLQAAQPGNCCDELERARRALADVPF